MDRVHLESVNEVHSRIRADSGTLMELKERFTFEVPGYRFTPAYRNGRWDGKIRLIDRNGLIYKGLAQEISNFCKTNEYEYSADAQHADEEFSIHEAKEFIDSLNLPFEPYDYQIEAFVKSVRKKRMLLLSPTSSGKSLIIYMLARYYGQADLRSLIVVPTIGLVAQLAGDFKDYGYEEDVHMIQGGKEKNTKHLITVTTWQSIFKQEKDWFSSFGVTIVDEAHLAKAKSIVSIMEKLTECEYRFGLTGTLDGSHTNSMVLSGLFGAVKRITTTAELMERGIVATLKIKVLVLGYPDADRKKCPKDYQDELDWIVRHEARNKFIKNLCLSLNGNVLVLYQFVEKHGDVLFEQINSSTDRKVYYIHGGVSSDIRNEIRAKVDSETDSITIASVGTSSTGMNVKNFDYLIFVSPSKSKIRNLQSIGRTLRISDRKNKAILYDIADDLSYGKRRNYTMKHLDSRLKIYDDEQFDYRTYSIKIGHNVKS